MIILTDTLKEMATQPDRFLKHWQQGEWMQYHSLSGNTTKWKVCKYPPLGLALILVQTTNSEARINALELPVDVKAGYQLNDKDMDDPFFEPYWKLIEDKVPHKIEVALNRTLSTCAKFLLNRRNAGTNTSSRENPMNAPAKRTTSKTKSAKNAILDGAKTAAASTVADRIRRLLTKRLANTPLQPIVDFIPDDVLNFLFAMAVSTVADYAPGVPKRDAVKTTAMLAVEGSSHDASRALLGFLADLFAEIIEDTKDVISNLEE